MPKFEFISKSITKVNTFLPKRSTLNSAGYDFEALEIITIPSCWGNIFRFLTFRPVKPTVVRTYIKAKMASNEVLYLYNRSSNPKKGLIMANGVGVIDSDYYNNSSNEGEIMFLFYNIMPWSVKINIGEKIGQGVFSTFKKTLNDSATGTRTGGMGSTGK